MIFCVEDDGNIRELVVYTWKVQGFRHADSKMEVHSLKLWH